MTWKVHARPPGGELDLTSPPVAHAGQVFSLWGTSEYTARGSNVFDCKTRKWSALTSPKVTREDAVAVSAGDDLLVWVAGGGQRLGASGRWRPMATAKQPGARRYPRQAWTGRELIVWGGATGHRGVLNGAAYDPATDTWRKLPTQGAPPSHNGAVLWSGSELHVWGGQLWGRARGDFKETLEGRAYDPAANKWRTLAKLPKAGIDGEFARIGDIVLFVDRTEAWRYEARADLWEPCAPLTLPAKGALALVAGDDRVVVTCGRDVLEYVVKRDTWKRLAQPPAAAVVESRPPYLLWLDGTLHAFARNGGVWRA